MEIIVSVMMLLVLAHIGGELAEQVGIPSIAAEVGVGILVGPAALGFITPNEGLQAIANVGIFMLVILAGFEMKPEDIHNALKKGTYIIGWCGLLIPFATGFIIGEIYGLTPRITASLFLGLCISITALPVVIRILMDLKMLHTETGKVLVASVITDDVVSLVVLAIILNISDSGDFISGLINSGIIFLKVIIFGGLIVLVNRFFRRKIGLVSIFPIHFRNLISKLKKKESLFALTILFVLVFSAVTELMGLHFIIGAFFGSLILSAEVLGKKYYESVEKAVSAMHFGFLAPVFFAYMGMLFTFNVFNNWILLLVILIAAIVSKIAGGFLGGKLVGFPAGTSFTLGCGMVGRGIMELVIANIGLENHLIDEDLFSALVFIAIITTLTTPFLLKLSKRLQTRNKWERRRTAFSPPAGKGWDSAHVK
ncbi:MAG: cation:proton antiporter [Thermoplasmata archaeon]